MFIVVVDKEIVSRASFATKFLLLLLFMIRKKNAGPFIEDSSRQQIIGEWTTARIGPWKSRPKCRGQKIRRERERGRGIFTENFNPSQMCSCIYMFRCGSQSASIRVVVDTERNFVAGIVEILACVVYMWKAEIKRSSGEKGWKRRRENERWREKRGKRRGEGEGEKKEREKEIKTWIS